MARVTKINVGGTNYDIAHEGELKNSGFEVVTELPTTGLFEGREVIYNGKKYVYSSGWKEEITANTMYEANLRWGGRNISYGYSPVDGAMMSELSANVMAFPNPTGISVEYSQDGGVTWLDYEATDEQKVNLFTSRTKLYCGKGGTANLPLQLRITITPMECGLYTILNKIIVLSSNESIIKKCMCTLKGLTGTNVDAGNEDDSFYETIVDRAGLRGTSGYNVLNFDTIYTRPVNMMFPSFYHRLRLIFEYEVEEGSTSKPLTIISLRFFGNGRWTLPSNLATNNHLYSYDWKQNAKFPAKVESKEVINFDVNNIEPTQTGSSVTKTSTWLWQYLVQGVNWLRANDNTKLDKRAYNQIYTNCGYVNFTSTGATCALIIELPFAPDGDANNSMTFIELNVYSHKKGCSKYIIGVYSYSQNSQFEWSVYSYMGYNYFSKISFGRRTDNNNIVVVLGDFTDFHKNEHFSISHIITGFSRNNDDTDGFLLYTDSDSNNYSSLKQSTNNPLNISYDDLTDRPNLATVATSGSYNDLTDKPALYEANLLWGGRNIAAGFSPIDAAMMSEMSANVMAFPNPTGISIEYSRDGGVTWQDYGATDEEKVNLFTSSTSLFCGKPAPDGLTATVGYQLRITITPIDCGLYTRLDKIIMKTSRDGSDNCWATFKGLKAREVAAGNEDDAYYDTFVNKAYISGWPGFNVLNFNSIQTAQSTTDPTHAKLYYRLRLIFGYDSAYDLTPYAGLRIMILRFFGNGRYDLPSNLATNNHLYSYDWQKNAKFPAKVESKEVINFDVNNIEPTQTGSSVSKTSTWLWQYLVQGINWLKANKFSGSYEDLTNTPNLATVATSGSYNDLTNTPTQLPNPNALNIMVLDSEGALLGPSIVYDGVAANYLKLIEGYGIKLSNTYLNSRNNVTINLKQIAGTTLLGNANDTTDYPQAITMAQLRTMLGSSTLNGITVNLGDTATLPCFISVGGTLYQVRITNNWLQIYRNGIWANLYYLSSNPPTVCHYITDLSDPSWYDESVTEYELDNSATTQLLSANGSVNLANWIKDINANQITFNSSVIASKDKGALDNIISNLKGNGYSVFVENDIDTILQSGNDWVISIKIKRFNDTYKAIIECYVAR